MSIPDPMLRLSTQSQGGKDSLLPYLITFTIRHAPFSCQWHAILMPVTCHSHDSFAPSRSIMIPVSWHSPDSHANSYWLSRAPRSNPENVKRLSGVWYENGEWRRVTGRRMARDGRDWHGTGMRLVCDGYRTGVRLSLPCTPWQCSIKLPRDIVVSSYPVTM